MHEPAIVLVRRLLLLDVQTISIVIAASGLFVAAVNQILSRRRAEKTEQLTLETRQAQLFMQVYNRWNTPDIQRAYGSFRFLYMPDVKDYEDYLQKYSIRNGDSNNLEPWVQGNLLSTYFEGLGVLVKKGLIDVDLVEDLFSRRIEWFWETFSPLIPLARNRQNDPKLYDSIEYLYNEIKKRQQQRAIAGT
jgi:hypothetical protein